MPKGLMAQSSKEPLSQVMLGLLVCYHIAPYLTSRGRTASQNTTGSIFGGSSSQPQYQNNITGGACSRHHIDDVRKTCLHRGDLLRRRVAAVHRQCHGIQSVVSGRLIRKTVDQAFSHAYAWCLPTGRAWSKPCWLMVPAAVVVQRAIETQHPMSGSCVPQTLSQH